MSGMRAGKRWLGFADRALPRWSGRPFRNGEVDVVKDCASGRPAQLVPRPDDDDHKGLGEAGGERRVLLFADTFNRYFEPENLRAAVRVLRAAGFTPVVPAGGPLCCGRTYLSAGLVDRARAEARRTLAALGGGFAGGGVGAVLPDDVAGRIFGVGAGRGSRGFGRAGDAVDGVPGAACAGFDVPAGAGSGACAWALPSEGVRGVSGCVIGVAASSGVGGDGDPVIVLRHGGRVRVSGGDAGGERGNGGGVVAACRAGGGGGGLGGGGRDVVPAPDRGV